MSSNLKMTLYVLCVLGADSLQVLGIAPCQNLATLPASTLASVLMNYRKALESKKVTYTKNLTLLVYTYNQLQEMIALITLTNLC